MSVSNVVGSALAQALSPPARKPAAPQADAAPVVPVRHAPPAATAQAPGLAQSLGKEVLASLLRLQGGADPDGDGDGDGAAGGVQPSGAGSGRHIPGTLETGSPDPSSPLALRAAPSRAQTPSSAA